MIRLLPVRDGGTVSMREHQQRMTEVGRIRLGVFNPEGRGRPEKLDRFRFTSADGDLIAAVADQYGGTPGQYTPQRGNGVQWEVISQAREALVYVPAQRIDPWLEKWKPGLCERRCDGVTETISGEDCFCAARRVGPKDMCKPTVRVQLMLAEVPGIGTWRLESHGAYAAGELATLAPLVAALPMPCPAKLMLRQESRSWMEGGERRTTTFYVPWLHISAATPSQLMLGGDALTQALAASTARAVEAAPERAALTMGPVQEFSTLPAQPTTPPATPPATLPADPVRLADAERAVILGKIEEAATVERLKEIAGKLVARGVKDEKVKAALKSKAAGIAAAVQIAERRAANDAHQAALKDKALEAAREHQATAPRDEDGRLVPDGTFHPDGTFTLLDEPPEFDLTYGGHEMGGAPEDVPPSDEDYDLDAEFTLIYPAAGPFGWTTTQTNEWIKKYCFVEKLSQVTGAKLHAMRMEMINNPGHFQS